MSQLVPLPITPPPGMVITESGRSVQGRWTFPWFWNRFMKGKPQKMGGWVQAFTAPTSGIPRCILAWTDLFINRFLAAGTYRKLYVYDQYLIQNDITPIRFSSAGIGGGSALTNPFTTTNGSSIVTVSHTANGVVVGDQVIFTSVGSAVGGITALQLTNQFIVSSVIDPNTYTFDSGVVASSGATGGGTVQWMYEINIGTENNALGLGWGVGGWGQGTWGTPRATSTLVFEARCWALDHFGKILVGTYNGGTLYTFDPTQVQPWGGVSQTNPRAIANTAAIAAGITDGRSVFVTPERYVVMLRENLVVSASNQGDFNTWVPATNNTAWSRTFTDGTKLISGAALAPFQSLIWTDGAVHLLQWTGDIFIYRSSLLGKDCGLFGTNANICTGGVAYWISPSDFMMFDGSVHAMPNSEDIRKYIFDNLNITQAFTMNCGYNPIFDEVWFNMPLFGSASPNYLIIFHKRDNCWTVHPGITRVSITNYVSGDNRPYCGDASGFIYQHENTLDGNGVAINSIMTLAPTAIEQSLQAMDIEGVRFDPYGQIGNVSASVQSFDEILDPTQTQVAQDIDYALIPTSPIPQDTNTTLLLHFDGSFNDASLLLNPITPVGGASISPTIFKFGIGSAQFDGVTGYATIPDAPGLRLTGDYTVELWVNPSTTNPGTIIGKTGANSWGAPAPAGDHQGPWQIFADGLGHARFFATSVAIANWDIANNVDMGPIATGTWTHLAVVRSGNAYTTFNNGQIVSTFTSALVPYQSTDPVGIGHRPGFTLGGDFFAGNVDEVRITQGVARWTANFAVPLIEYSVQPMIQGLSDLRVAGRYIGFTLQQNDLGSYFRFGSPVALARPTARRR